MKKLALLLALVALALPVAVAAETLDNPSYQSWAKVKVGTSVVYRSVADMGTLKTESEITYRLVELTPEKADIELTTVVLANGQKIESPATKVSYAAKVDAAAAPKVEAPKTEPAKVDAATTDAKVETPAGAFACKLTEVRIDAQGSEGSSKVWSSDEVPGTLVKSETALTKPMAMRTTIELVKLEKK